MCSTELNLPLLPSHFLIQLLFLGHFNLTFSSISTMKFVTSYEPWKGNGEHNHVSLRGEPECRSWGRALRGTGGFLFPVSILLQAVHVHAHQLVLFLHVNYKRSKRENIDLLKLPLFMVKSWFWPLSSSEQQSFKSLFQTISSQYFFSLPDIKLWFSILPSFDKDLKMESLPMACENSLPSDILYHLEIQIFLFHPFWASLETSYSAQERWRRAAHF